MALILRNGGSQSPDRWLKEPRNIHFSYGNGTSTCLSASCTTSLYSNSWSVGNKKASKSGNTAKASATGVRYTNGHAVQSITRTVTLTCSATGNFS